MALPPHVKHCRVDDAEGTLYVAESGFGLRAYDADPESAGARATAGANKSRWKPMVST